ncbi:MULTISPECIES: hypothetical protein [Bacteria]|uniref:hypothetical protein n=1 Tax=Bacteria TaxID=2 RepID=UPI003C7975E3
MSDYTPTTEDVRRSAVDYWPPITAEEFDRWLVAHDAEVRAETVEYVARIAADTLRMCQRGGVGEKKHREPREEHEGGAEMSDYTPTDDEIRAEYLSRYSHANIRDRYDADLMMAGFEDGVRWAAEVRAAALAGQGEGRRWYAACWREDDGTLEPLESETILREYAEAEATLWRGNEERDPAGQPDRVVLATKVRYPWLPVPADETGGSGRDRL